MKKVGRVLEVLFVSALFLAFPVLNGFSYGPESIKQIAEVHVGKATVRIGYLK
jgi:hypothetical protein